MKFEGGWDTGYSICDIIILKGAKWKRWLDVKKGVVPTDR